jgi:porin
MEMRMSPFRTGPAFALAASLATSLAASLMPLAAMAQTDKVPSAKAPVAQKTSAPQQQPYSLLTTPRLLSFPGSPFDDLRSRGIDIGGTVTSFYQGHTIGSGDKTWRFGTKGDLKIVLDSEKMGLWYGTVIVMNQEWVWGRDVLKTGAGVLLPVNTAIGFPRLGGDNQNTSINVTQKFGDAFSVSFGKFNMLDLASGVPILGGGGLDTFTHLGVGAPASGVTPPYIFGGMATLRTPWVILTGMLYDPRNAQDPEVIRKPFTDGRTFSLSATVPTKFFDLPGFYGARVAYSDAKGLDLSRIPELALPGVTQTRLQKQGYRFLSLSGQQFIWMNPQAPLHNIGVFAEVAVSDGNPNPLKGHVIGGLSGTGVFDRPLDRWGIGYFKYVLSKDAKESLALVGDRRRNEWGVEAYYNLAVTPWLRVTGTVTWIRPSEADKKNATFAGVRTQIRF